MAKVDPKFFEKAGEIYVAMKNLPEKEEKAILEFAQYVDRTLNEEGGEEKKQ